LEWGPVGLRVTCAKTEKKNNAAIRQQYFGIVAEYFGKKVLFGMFQVSVYDAGERLQQKTKEQ
jgi:hypothetical protein